MSSDESLADDTDTKKRPLSRTLLIDGAFLCVFLLTAITAWLATGVRDVSFLKNYVAYQIEKEAPGIQVSFGSLMAGIFVDTNALVVDVDQMQLHADSGMNITLPKARLRLNSLKLLFGKVHLKELEIFSPALAVHRNEDGTLALEVATDEKALTAHTSEPVSFEHFLQSPFLALADRLRIHDLKIFITGDDKKAEFHLPLLLASFERHGEPKTIKLQAAFTKGEKNLSDNKGLFSANLKFNTQSGEVKGNLSAQGFDAGTLQLLHPSLAGLSGLTLPVAVEAEFYKENKEAPFSSKMTIDGEKGTFASREFPETIPLDKVHVDLSAPEGLETIIIKDFAMSTAGVKLKGAGTLTLSDKLPGGDFEVTAENMDVDALPHYWPLRLAPESRKWVTERIKGGHVPHAKAKISFTSDDLEAENLPKSFINATVEVKSSSVVYMPNMPKVTDVDATAHFTGTTMDIDVHSGKTLNNTVVTKADVNILDFNDVVTPAHIAVNVNTVASEALTLLSKEHLNIGTNLNLDPATATGTGAATLTLDFPLYPEDGNLKGDVFDNMNYAIKADLKTISLKKVRNKWNVSNMDGTFSADNKVILINGNGGLQGLPVSLGVKYDQAKRSMEYTLKGQVPVEKLPDFEVTIPDVFTYSGTFGASVVMTDQGDNETVNATLDLKSTKVGIPDLNWTKDVGTPGNLFLTYQKLPQGSALPEITFNSPDFSTKGSATMTADKDLATLELPQFKYFKNNFALSYKKNGGVRGVRIQGDTLDLAAMKSPDQTESNPFKKFENVDLQVDINHFRASSSGGELKDLHAHISCPQDFCINGEAKATTPSGKAFTYSLKQEGAARKVRIQSDDAGQVLSTFDLSDHVQGGKTGVDRGF